MPAGKTTLQNKWVYRLKEEDGEKHRYKSRLMVKGFEQKKGIYFDEREGKIGVQVNEELVWLKTGSKAVLSKI